MYFKENETVYTPLGEKVSNIDRVVVDPGTEEVTQLVVKKGLLFTQDKAIPVNQVGATGDRHVTLRKSALDPDKYLDFEMTQYIPVGRSEDFRRRKAEQARRLIFYQTQAKTPLWREGVTQRNQKPLYSKKSERNIPEGNIPLEEGA